MRSILDSMRLHAISRIVRRPVVGYGLVLAAGVCVFAFYSVRLGCDVSWDMKNYHYYTPHALLNGRIGFDYTPAQIQTFLNPLSFVPFYLAAAHLEPVQTGFLLGGLHGISLGILFMIAHMLFASAGTLSRFGIALSCAVMGTAGPIFLGQLGTSYNDILIAPIVLIALSLYMRKILARVAPDRRSGKGILVLTGLLMGIATGLKLVFLVWLAAFAVAVFVVERGWAVRFRSTGLFAAGSLAGLLLSRGYWMALLWSKFESPLFPFYNTIFRSPLYYDYDFVDRRLLPETMGSAMKLPFETSDGRMGVLLGVVLFSILVFVGKARWSRRGSRAFPLTSDGEFQREVRASVFLTIFFLVGLVIWEAQFSIPRYTLPLELLAPLVVVGLLRASATRRLSSVLAVLAVGSAIVMLMQPRHSYRTEWFADFFNVDAPQFEKPEEVLVILADDVPMSYVIPFFQPEVRFVCPWNNFTKPWSDFSKPTDDKPMDDGEPLLIVQEMVNVIRSHEGPLFALAPGHLRRVKGYGVAPPTSKGKRAFDPQPLSFPENGDLHPPSSGLYLSQVEVVPLRKPLRKRRDRN